MLARRTLLLGLLALGCPKGGPTSKRAVRVVLVRHAEKQTEPAVDDPPLTAAGKDRAASLVRAVGPDVRAILSTDTLRTRQTATPVAEATGVSIEIMQPLDIAKIRAVMDRLDGGTLLVVGHSNSLPPLVEALSGETITLDETAYGDLFIIEGGKLQRGSF